MKYAYNVGYNSYEECPDVTLFHEQKFTKENIEDFLVEYIKSNKDLPNKEWEYKNNLSEIIFDYETGGFIRFLCEKKGFEEIKYEAIYKPFGWANVFDEEDWGENRGELLKKLTKKI